MTMREQPGVPQQFPQGPRSYRPGSHVQRRTQQEPRPQGATQRTSVRTRPDETQEYDDRDESTRLPSSTRSYQQAPQATPRNVIQVTRHDVPPRRSATQDYPAPRPRQAASVTRRFHWLVYVGIALLVMVVGWCVLSVVLAWGGTALDDLHYGRPRTFQMDQVVGHHDSADHPSHFIALNLKGQILVIEIQGGDPSRSKVYTGPNVVGSGDLAPVTLDFKDVNGDGKPDMLINIGNTHFVLINDNDGFRLPKAGEPTTL